MKVSPAAVADRTLEKLAWVLKGWGDIEIPRLLTRRGCATPLVQAGGNIQTITSDGEATLDADHDQAPQG